MSLPVTIKNFAILGFGVTGKSILNFLLKSHTSQIVINIYDEKSINKNELSELLHNKLGLGRDKTSLSLSINTYTDLKELIEHNQNDLQLIISSPGIKPSKLKELGLYERFKVVSDLELFLSDERINTDKIFAITGTNGKSTACHLLAHLLASGDHQIALGGNFGTPVLDFLNDIDYSAYVLELSSYQLALTDHLPCLAASCLNVSIDHLEWHGNFENYINDKLKIYANSKFDILNLDQKYLLEHYFKKTAGLKEDSQIIAYTLSETVKANFIENNSVSILWVGSFLENTSEVINDSKYINFGNLSVIAINNLPLVLQSQHNLSNLLAVLSLLLAKYHNETYEENPVVDFSAAVNFLQKYLTNIKSYDGLPFRCQLITESNKIKVFNDSKSTNLDATLVALESLKHLVTGRIWLILGGLVKEDVDDSLSQNAFKASLDQKVGGVIVFGKNKLDRSKLLNIVQTDKKQTFKVIELYDKSTDKSNNESVVNILDKMIEKIFLYALPNDAILFSPACASFDMFNNYIHRGEMFNQRIDEYIKKI